MSYYHIEFVYRVWDNVNGNQITIQQYDAEGVYEFSEKVFTVQQIPGIIEVLTKLRDGYYLERNKYTCDPPVHVDPTINARSGRPDPPF